jgi:hypothetical protein
MEWLQPYPACFFKFFLLQRPNHVTQPFCFLKLHNGMLILSFLHLHLFILFDCFDKSIM